MSRPDAQQYTPHDGDGIPKAPIVSIITWNPGNKRKRNYSTDHIKFMLNGNWHVILGQETFGVTDQLHQRLHFYEWEAITVAFDKDTFENPSWTHHQWQHSKKEFTGLVIGSAKFRRPVGGVESFTAASLHFHHTPAKKHPKPNQYLQRSDAYVKTMAFRLLAPISIR